jgi:hypothetical protein
MNNNQSRFPPHDKKLKPLIPIFLSIVFFLLISCSFSNPLALFFPTSTNTPTRTFTPSPTSTSTPTFTATATATETPTPMPPRFEIQTKADESTLVMDLTCGYQFILPKAWKTETTFFDVTEIGKTTLVANNSSIYPSLSMYIRTFAKEMPTLELELYHYSAEKLGSFNTALSQVLTTNVYGTALGTLKISNITSGYGYTTGDETGDDSIMYPGTSKNKNRIRPLVGPGFYQTYEILFYCEEQVINIKFVAMQLMYTIQNSIQFK